MLRTAIAGCLGMFVKHGSADEVRLVLLRGPLGSAAASKWDRLGHALTLAASAASAPQRSAFHTFLKWWTVLQQTVVRYSCAHALWWLVLLLQAGGVRADYPGSRCCGTLLAR